MLHKIKNSRYLVLILLFSPLFLSACGGSNNNAAVTPGIVTFLLNLSGDSTVPQTAATGSGTATLMLNPDSGELSGSANLSGLSGSVTGAHIHDAIAGLAGGVIVTLELDAGNASQVNVPAGTTLDAAQIAAMMNSEYYINIHTVANASGELRGQIVAANQQVLRVMLEGENEVPAPVATSNAGTGYVTVDTTSREIRGNIRNTGLDDANAAHIHSAFAGINGGVVVGLTKDSGDTALWTLPDNTILDTTQLASLLAGEFYFNVHTPANGSGEVRGQIIPDNIELERVSLRGDFQVPTPVASAGSAVGYVTVNEDSGAVVANIITDGLADTTAAHFHSGYAGTNGGVTLGLSKDTSDATLFATANGDTLDATALSELFEGKLYLNVHTTSNPSGEVRGQISPGNIKVIRSELDGSQEVPPVVTTATGIGYTTVDEDSGDINANIRTSGLTVISAHVHGAATGSNGGIVLGLTQDQSDTDFWSASAILDATQLDAFKADGLYYNAHSTANANGEIRAQINR